MHFADKLSVLFSILAFWLAW